MSVWISVIHVHLTTQRIITTWLFPLGIYIQYIAYNIHCIEYTVHTLLVIRKGLGASTSELDVSHHILVNSSSLMSGV